MCISRKCVEEISQMKSRMGFHRTPLCCIVLLVRTLRSDPVTVRSFVLGKQFLRSPREASLPMSDGPTVRRRRLGAELRRLREAHSRKLDEVAGELGLVASTLSRIETGKAPIKTYYLNKLLDMYEVADPGARQVLVDMGREGHRKGWWAEYDDVLPSGFDIYVGLEAETAAVRSYEVSVVHGLLQTADYARAVLGEMFPRHTADQIGRLGKRRIP